MAKNVITIRFDRPGNLILVEYLKSKILVKVLKHKTRQEAERVEITIVKVGPHKSRTSPIHHTTSIGRKAAQFKTNLLIYRLFLYFFYLELSMLLLKVQQFLRLTYQFLLLPHLCSFRGKIFGNGCLKEERKEVGQVHNGTNK